MADREFPWFRYHLSDILTDVEGMSCEAEGTYHRVVRLLWKRGPLTMDELGKRFGVPFLQVEHVLTPTNVERSFSVSWLEKERAIALNGRQQKKAAGEASGIARGEKNGRSTDAQRSFNARSTYAQQTFNTRLNNSHKNERALNEHSTDVERSSSYSLSYSSSTSSEKERAGVITAAFPGDAFARAWNAWLALLMSKDTDYQDATAAQSAMDALKPYDEAFAISLLTLATKNRWNDFLFPETWEKYQAHKARKGTSRSGSATERRRATTSERTVPITIGQKNRTVK